MTYQIIYSSRSRRPMPSDDLEALLEDARARNGVEGISGALIYADGTFLQILEGDQAKLRSLMDDIRRDVRHEAVTILREGEVPAARFRSWKMAYLGATPEQVAGWTSGGVATGNPVDEDRDRTARFAQDILGLLASDASGDPVGQHDIDPDRR